MLRWVDDWEIGRYVKYQSWYLTIFIHCSPILWLILDFPLIVMSSDMLIVVILILEFSQDEILSQDLCLLDIVHCDLVHYVLLFSLGRLITDTIYFTSSRIDVNHETASRVLNVRVKLYVDIIVVFSKLVVVVPSIDHTELSWLDVSEHAVVFSIESNTVFVKEFKVFLDLIVVHWTLSIEFQPLTFQA